MSCFIEQENGLLYIRRNKADNVDVTDISEVTDTWSEKSFVYLQSRQHYLSQLIQIINNVVSGCVLLEGESGCGKSLLLQILAKRFSKDNDIIIIHLGEQIDSKVLLGTFSCTSVPGKFIWLPGLLTEAVMKGRWVVLEDLDHSPPDVISLLLPLIKTNQLVLPGYIEPVKPVDGFRLFATRRLGKDGVKVMCQNSGLFNVLEGHVHKLLISQHSRNEIIDILNTLHPHLISFVPNLISIVVRLLNGEIDLRKLIKLCNRITPYVHNGHVTSTDDMMLELYDVLLGHLEMEKRYKAALELRSLCGGISCEKVQYLCLQYKPSVQVAMTTFTVGRAFLPRSQTSSTLNRCFAYTRSSLTLLEWVGRCVQFEEPVLLVGETGVGKTATISYLADMTGNKLVSINLSQQTDSSDLLGGFKPVPLSQFIFPLRQEFEGLFRKTFDIKKNNQFLANLQAVIIDKDWKKLINVILHSVKIAKKKLRGTSNTLLYQQWEDLQLKTVQLQKQLNRPQANFAFAFIEGALVEAVRNGWWVLLDEVNLASPEALQCLNSLIEGKNGSFLLTEKVDSKPVERHLNFRLFCCMNPATDIGKRSLPSSMRNRFSEFYVDELKDPADLRMLVIGYLTKYNVTPPLIDGIIKFYQTMRELSETRLQDGTGRRPHYSLRTLCRSLQYASDNGRHSNIVRSLYEGFLMSFYTQLHQNHHNIVSVLAQQCLCISDSQISVPLNKPQDYKVVQVEGFWIPQGLETPVIPAGYIITPSIRRNLTNLARIVSGGRYPVLLQGPTSAGKTSLVQYLAKVTGHRCVRVNNHEHTDLQEYIGMYSTNIEGKLEFQEGVLIQAMRQGHWIILDELNLAPTDVLEALNRVLDDNRELFIPETQQLVKAHSHFMLFGTQNPPGIYGGRKLLSRAFRNRFIELHYDDIPSNELVQILHHKCALPETYAKKMVAVMKELQQRRSLSGIFEGKYGLITLRDLFWWAERYRRSPNKKQFFDWEQLLAEDGFMLLAGKLRTSQEEQVIIEVIEKHFKKIVDPKMLFGINGGLATKECLKILNGTLPDEFQHLVWTPELLRMGVLVHRAILFDEPVLLVGNTGCGKTTLCQLLSKLLNRTFYSINCHIHTEAADFLGGLRPIRNRTETEESNDAWALFEWSDGILVKAMQDGGCLLVDEISLADDAVLERLNSVLEPERCLLIAEKGGRMEQVYEVTARDGFLLLATMNPGGDYGKKELSPALRNRFVEIWCPDMSSLDGYKLIIDHNLNSNFKGLLSWSDKMLYFINWLKKQVLLIRYTVTTRDILMWVEFMNKTSPPLSPSQSFIHGAEMVFVDSLGCGGVGLASDSQELRQRCISVLRELCERCEADGEHEMDDEIKYGVYPFFIDRGSQITAAVNKYCLTAKGPSNNLLRLLRALQLGRPLMLEGDPGVGKTSLVSALASASGHALTRINLSEHTDISDLFGSDLPVENVSGIKFEWRDGPFLKALCNSEWILLDEMNLASQSVLEGLNACLDHRGEIYIPELNKLFRVPLGTRLFACQNPLHQGGGRKGLPRSFVNRFTQVYMEPMSCEDLVFITCSLYPELTRDTVERMIGFNNKVQQLYGCHGNNTSMLWEFNLRDILRWCQIMKENKDYDPSHWIQLIYCCRLRNQDMRNKVLDLYRDSFQCTLESGSQSIGGLFHISQNILQIGVTRYDRGLYNEDFCHNDINTLGMSPFLLPCQLPLLEMMLQNVKMNWMTILVGGSNSGKLTLVHTLSALCGHKLLEFPMNSDTDTMELLGGFEQVNPERQLSNIVSRILYIVKCLETEHKRQNITNKLNEIMSFLKSVDIPKDNEELIILCTTLQHYITDILLIAQYINSSLQHDVHSLILECQSLHTKLTKNKYTGQFEWVESLLVSALTNGYWLLISNANFCSPSVLDRLNPLLEPNGMLTIDERGIVGGDVPVVKPHPEFRLFLTMDPSHGEISRAMRNRGIEIAILPENVNVLHSQLHGATHDYLTLSLKVSELVSDPVRNQVKRDLYPLLTSLNDLINESASSNIKVILRLESQLRVFHDLTTINDISIRYDVLCQLAEKLSDQPVLSSVVMATSDVLSDEKYKQIAQEIINMMESILGTCYESHINLLINPALYYIISGNKDITDKVNYLQVLSNIQRLYYLNKRLSSCKTGWTSQPSLFQMTNISQTTGLLTKSIIVKLDLLITTLLSSISDIADVLLRELPSSLLWRTIDTLKLFIIYCHVHGGSLSSVAMGWSLLKNYCIDPLISQLQTKTDLQSLLMSLSVMDELNSFEDQVLNAFRKTLGAPLPPGTDLQLNVINLLQHYDNKLVNVPTAPPFYLLDSPTASKRSDVLLMISARLHDNQEETLQKMINDFNVTIPPLSSYLVSNIAESALNCLTDIYLSGHCQQIEMIFSFTNYCLQIPQWPLTALVCTTNQLNKQVSGEDSPHFIQLLELISTDPHLRLLNNSSVTTCINSISDVCFSLCSPPQTGPATIENYGQKLNELRSLLQFLFLQGLSSSSPMLSFNQDVQLMKHVMESILRALSLSLTSGDDNCEDEVLLTRKVAVVTELISSQLVNRGKRSQLLPNYWTYVLQCLDSSSDILSKYLDVTNITEVMIREIATVRVHLGLVLVLLLCPVSPLDPLIVEGTHNEVLNQLVSSNQLLLESYQHHLQLSSGGGDWNIHQHQTLYTGSSVEGMLHWTSQLKEIERDVPRRLQPDKYGMLVEGSTHVLQTLCHPNKIFYLMSRDCNEINNWFDSVVAAVHQLRQKFPSYNDLVQPFTAALSLLTSGLRVLSKFTTTTKDWFQDCIVCLVQFPYWNGNESSSVGELARVKQLLNLCQNYDIKKNWKICLKLVSVAVETALHVLNCFPHDHPPTVINIISQLLDVCYHIWEVGDQQEREKKQEEESLYCYKPKTINITIDEEEEKDKHLLRLFPNFDNFFKENTDDETSQDPLPDSVPDPLPDVVDMDSSSQIQFSEHEMAMIRELHFRLFNSSNITSPTLLPHLTRYRIAHQLTEDHQCTKEISLSGHLKACYSLLTTIQDDKVENTRPFIIYRDPSIQEAKRVLPILRALMSQVEEILLEWPDYPVLKQILKSCESVLSLDVDSPLMMILSGLENVLKKSQDWESYASSRLSLSKHLSSLTELIIQWRILELSCWDHLLEMCKDDIVTSSSTWWFYLYGLYSESSSSCVTKTKEELVESLQLFMETSSLGEYRSRLDMIIAFSQQLASNTDEQLLSDIFMNIYNYYNQFLPAIESTLDKQVEPVQKEFKEYLTILRWKDGNYWSIKQSSEKSHRTLLRHMTKYKDILTQPVKPVMSTSNIDTTDKQTSILQLLINSLNNSDHTSLQLPDDHTSLLNIKLDDQVTLTAHDCYNRMHTLITRYTSYHILLDWCQKLDMFTGDVIMEYHELQQNNIPCGVTMEQRRSAVKLILMKRRKALNDLFKTLKQFGLSHRKGEELTDDIHLLTLTHPSLPNMIPLIEDCNIYFFRCVLRTAALNTAMTSPSKELTMSHIVWIRGYSRQLMAILCEQKQTLAEGLKNMNIFEGLVDRLTAATREPVMRTCSVNQYQSWQLKLLSLLQQCLEIIHSSQDLLDTCPDIFDLSLTPYCTSVLPPVLSCGNKHCLQDAVGQLSLWETKLNETMKISIKLNKKMTSNKFYFMTKSELELLMEGYEMINDFVTAGIVQCLKSLLGESDHCPDMFEYMVHLKNKIIVKYTEFKSWFANIKEDCVTEQSNELTNQNVSVTWQLEELVRSIMLGIQHVIEKEREIVKLEKEEDDDNIPLCKTLHEFSLYNIHNIDCHEVTEHLTKLLVIIATTSYINLDEVCGLLHQYQLLLKRVWLEMGLVYRTFSKMTSILLEIYANLISKGFCVPSEFSENAESTDGEEFLDIDAGGFDEGEGTKNVSDKVEKDNLDTGGTPDEGGGEKKEGDENGVEMDNDFEGDMEDVPQQEEEREESFNNEEDDELDKKMGQFGNDGNTEDKEQLDRNMWAPEDDKHEENDINKESGGGTTLEEESQLAAKEDGKREGDGSRQHEDLGQSDNDEVINDQDDYFDSGGGSKEKQLQEEEEIDFGDLNIDEGIEEDKTEQDNELSGDEEEMETDKKNQSDHLDVDKEEEMDEDKCEGEGDNECEGEGQAQAVEDIEESLDPSDSKTYTSSDMMYGVPQSQITPSQEQNYSNTETIDPQDVPSSDQQSTDQSNSASGNVTTKVETTGDTVIPLSHTATVQSRPTRRKHSQTSTPRSLADMLDRPIKRPRLMDRSFSLDSRPPNEGSDNNPLEDKDSDWYQHVAENESSDTIVWDCLNGTDDVGTGKQPLGEEPNDNNHNNDIESEIDKVINDEISLTTTDCQLVEVDDDNIVPTIDDENCQEMETDVIRDNVNERVIPTDSFFASGISNTITSDIDEKRLRESLQTAVQVLHYNNKCEDSTMLWIQYELLTKTLSHSLCEELRLILQPTETAQLKGDYRTGKRLNMRRIIPYIASNFQNDRIWLKRNKPSKRDYQILLAVDDSASMKENDCNQMAYESLALISTALQKLDCGQLGVLRFGESVEILHPLDQPFSPNQGGHILQHLTFSQSKTNFIQLLQSTETLFSKSLLQGRKISVDVSQLLVILSDGRGVFADGTLAVETTVHKLNEMGIFMVFIILDGLAKDSIVDIKVPTFIPGQPPLIRTYLETFPFPYYIVLREISALPTVLSQALRQWFELVTMAT